jgi:hypothetical protein
VIVPHIVTIKQLQAIVSVSLLAKLVADYGFSALPMLKAADISSRLLQDPKAKISLQQEFAFIRAMLNTIDDPDIGIHAGQCYRLNAGQFAQSGGHDGPYQQNTIKLR